jgi:hypothetical protein
MGFRQHKTEMQKAERRERYSCLRACGISTRQAVLFRDWTNNKIAMICRGEAKPIR